MGSDPANADTWVRNRSNAVAAATDQGPGGTETLTCTAAVDDCFGVVVINNAGTGTYTLTVSWSTTPAGAAPHRGRPRPHRRGATGVRGTARLLSVIALALTAAACGAPAAVPFRSTDPDTLILPTHTYVGMPAPHIAEVPEFSVTRGDDGVFRRVASGSGRWSVRVLSLRPTRVVMAAATAPGALSGMRWSMPGRTIVRQPGIRSEMATPQLMTL